MSDEAAFLSALNANPADDLTRLVYADWLDDRDEAAKAEYLRLVADFAQRDENLAGTAGSERFTSLAATIAEDWRTAAGSRFALILTGWADKIRAIKWIRELTGDGLGEAKAASESLPHVLFSNVPFENAAAAFARAREMNVAELRIVAGPPDEPPHSARYDLVVHVSLISNRANRTQTAEARTALAKLLATALDLSAEEANERAELNREIVLAPGLTIQEARNRRLALQPFVPELNSARGWWLWISRRVAHSSQQQ